MRKKHITLCLTIVTLGFTNQLSAQETTPTHQDSLNTLVEQYYELNLSIFKANSTVEDIDSLFGFFTEDFTYVHPKYGGEYSRRDLYEGYVRNQNNGVYDGGVVDIEVLNKITGLNAVTVQKRFITRSEGKTVKGNPEMTLFEFKGGKIARIVEYW